MTAFFDRRALTVWASSLAMAAPLLACSAPPPGEASGAGAGGSGGAGEPIDPGPAWYRQIEGPDDEESMAIAIDADRNLVVVGTSRGATDFGEGEVPAIGAADLFVAKYDTRGELLWSRRFGGALAYPTDVAVDGDDDVIVVGHYEGGSLQIGADTLGAPGDYDYDLFVAKLDRTGDPLWARRLGGPGFDFAGKVGVGPDGRVVVAGSADVSAILLASFEAYGAPIFERVFGSVSTNASFASPVSAVRVDPSGDIYLTGGAFGGADLGGGDEDLFHGGGIYLAKYAGDDGGRLWSRVFPSVNDGESRLAGGDGMTLIDGDVILSGIFAGDVDFGGGSFHDATGATYGAFVARLSGKDGAHRWSRPIPAAWGTGGRVFTGAGDTIVVTANLLGPVDLGGGALDASGTFAATYDATTGAFAGGRQLVEVGTMLSSTQNGFWGIGATAFDGCGGVVVETSFFGAHEYALGTIESAGWGDVLLARLPLVPVTPP
jgi:hypothetical protein